VSVASGVGVVLLIVGATLVEIPRSLAVPAVSYGPGPCQVSTFTFLTGPGSRSSTLTYSSTVAGCSWTASTDSNWFTLTQTSGTANGTQIVIPYSIAANGTGNPRSSNLTINTTTFVGMVQNSSNCTYTISPSAITIPASGGNSDGLNVTSSPAGCWWFPSFPLPTWIKNFSSSTPHDQAPEIVTFIANGPNNGPPLAATIGTGSDPPSPASFTITQLGTTGPPALTSLSPSTAAAGGLAFTVTINGSAFLSGATVYWNTTALTTTFVSSSQLTASVPASLLATTGTASISVISGGITTNSLPFTINPPGQSCNFTLSPASATFGASGGSASINVTATRPDCSWTAAASAGWINLPSPTNTGSATLNYAVAANPAGTSRTGFITIGSSTFTIIQGGTLCTYSLANTSQGFGAAGGSGTVTVHAPPGCAWSAVSTSPAVTFGASGGSGDGAVGYTVSSNSNVQRTAITVTVANMAFIVTEEGTGTTLGCAATVPSTPQVALEGRTEVVGDLVLNCSGVSGSLSADINLALNVNLTSTDAVLSVNGGTAINGSVSGANSVRWTGVNITPATGGTATLRISKVRADASELLNGSSITGKVTVDAGGAGVPVTGDTPTLATASRSLLFSRSQAIQSAGQSTIPLGYQEAQAQSFTANVTRLRMVLNNVPSTVQVYAPVFPTQGNSRAQLYSADAFGLGGSPVAGTSFAGGTYQQLTVTAGTTSATWLVLAADPLQVETWTFPLLLVNGATNDINAITVSGTLGPVSDVSVASATAPVPRYRDLSVPLKLTNLRMTTSVKSPGSTAPQISASTPHPLQATAGSTVTLVSTVVNDSSDASQAATNVVIENNLPTGMTVVSCSAPGATCNSSGNQAQVTVDTLGPGQTASVTVVAQIDSFLANGSVLDDSSSASSDQVNEDLGANSSGTSIVVLAGLVAVGGTPAFGTGNNQSFTFQFSNPSGFQNLGVVNVLINSAIDGRVACYLAYSVPSQTLFLVDDGGDAGGPFAGAAVLGNTSPIQNSQCSVSLTSAVGNGNALTLVLGITFKPAFGGNKIVYVAARDNGGGNTDWQPLGVWQDPFNSPVSITVGSPNPARGAKPGGQNQQFTFTFTDTNGTGDFGVLNILVNSALDGRHACYLAYSAPANTLFLVDDQGDAGGPFAGSTVLNGGSGGVSNSQCSVSAAGSTVTPGANSLSLTLNITFTPAFAGNRVVYAAARDRSDGNNTGWQAVGTWTIQ